MWNVVGPFEVGNHAGWGAVLEVVQSQNRRCPSPAEEDSGAQIVATVVDSVAAEGEEGMVDEVEGSVAVVAASVADVMTLGVVGVAVGTAAAASGV